METDQFRIESNANPLGYEIKRGETIFAQCRHIEAAKVVLEHYRKLEKEKVKLPYE
jgi:hypothetical protein